MQGGSTVGNIQVVDLLEALRALGADPAALCASVGLSERGLHETDARVSSVRLLALLARAERQLRDPLVGLHAGARAQPRGPLFYLLLSSPRLSDGLRLFTRFARVTIDTMAYKVAVDGDVATLTMEPGDPAIERSHHAIDYIVGANLSTFRRAIPGFQPLRVDLCHEEVGEPRETERVFGCPVRFGRRRTVMWFPNVTLGRVSAAANPAILDQIEKFTAVLFARISSKSARDRVADATRALLGRGLRADRASVAKQLGVSGRTLQRQLEEESVTFTAVHDGVRAELARALLTNRALKVEAIAQSVGFAEVASFSRAFTRWLGYSPSRYRDRLDHKRSMRLHAGRLRI